jgi:biopolymer transport protein ExbD
LRAIKDDENAAECNIKPLIDVSDLAVLIFCKAAIQSINSEVVA